MGKKSPNLVALERSLISKSSNLQQQQEQEIPRVRKGPPFLLCLFFPDTQELAVLPSEPGLPDGIF
jgi:hypothetical protein